MCNERITSSESPIGRHTASQCGSTIVALALLIASAGAIYFARTESRHLKTAMNDPERAPLYLPDVAYVRLVTFGYDTFASKLLWFSTVNYFGKEFTGTHDYRWLGHMCELVTTLDPKARHAVEFCGTLLSWIAKEPEKSEALLTRAIAQEPGYWRYRYLRGFNYWYFRDRLDLAKEDFLKASAIPGAPPFLASLASRLIAKDSGPTLARQFLEEMIANTTDPVAKKALLGKLLKARMTEQLWIIQTAADAFHEKEGRKAESVAELVEKGFLRGVAKDPYGGDYFLEDGTAKSTSKKKLLEFKGRTAKTGMFKEEFEGLSE